MQIPEGRRRALREEWILEAGYRQLKRLGKNTFLAMQESTCQLRIVKEVAGGKRRLTDTERREWKHFSHPGIPKVLDILEHGDCLYYIMDYRKGKTLQEIFDEQGSLGEKQLRGWMLQLCDILGYLHGRSPAVIHGDLKPSNIYCLSDGRLQLLDLGAAVRAGEGAGVYFGTAAFASPEQLSGEETLDVRSDLYSLGATFGYLLTGAYGEKIFEGRMGGDFYRILRRCMQEEPARRYASCSALKNALLRKQVRNRMICTAVLCAAAVCSVGGLCAVRPGHPGETAALSESEAGSMDQIDIDIDIDPQTEVIIQAGTVLQTETVSQNKAVLQTEPGIQAVTEEETVRYETLLNGSLSDIKSAILSAPDREEGYRKLLEVYLEDASFSTAEQLEMEELLEKTEEEFQKNISGYDDFLYELGITCWYYAGDGGNSSLGARWFEQLMEGEASSTLSEEKFSRVKLYVQIEQLRKNYQEKQGQEEMAPDFEALWRKLVLTVGSLSQSDEREARITLQLLGEILTQMYLYAGEFDRSGITAYEYGLLARQIAVEAEARRSLENTQEERDLLEAIEGRLALVKETLQTVFGEE